MTGARLLFPALRWDSSRGYDLDSAEVARALELGVGGFLLFGGPAEQAAAATRELQARASRPLLFGADLERGAGQQFEGCTALPPARALAELGPHVIRAAAELTAREARALGVAWLFAPVADVAVEADNPIVGTRAFGSDPAVVSEAVAAWVRGARAGGGCPCVKHFPGHGRTLHDSHATLPVVHAPQAALEREMAPFRAGLEAGAFSVMTAHVAFPALDPSGRPATVSSRVVQGLLRDGLGFQGVVATDALIMEGVGDDAARAAVEALGAGVDALLYPPDLERTAQAVARAVERGTLGAGQVATSGHRLDRLERPLPELPDDELPPWGRPDDLDRARGWASAALSVPEAWPRHAGAIELVEVDDDLGGPWPAPSRRPLRAALADAGVAPATASASVPRVVAVFAEPRGWKGRAGLSDAARRRLDQAVASAPGPVGVVLFGDPAWGGGLDLRVPTMVAWGGERLMQEAAGASIGRRR